MRRTGGSSLTNRIRRRWIDAIDSVADTTVVMATFLRAPRRWIISVPWRGRFIRRPTWANNERLAVIATAALTSAAVSHFTMWMGSDRLPRAAEREVADVSRPVDRARAPVALELSADRVSVNLGRVAAPVAPHRPAATTRTPKLTPTPTPTRAVRTPLPLARLPLVLAQDDSASQDAMLLQDRPVLMDAQMPVGTMGSAPLRPVPVASLATDRDRAGSAVGRRASDPGNSLENSAVARPAHAPLGLLVITQPEGARVTINGVGWGMTPLTVAHLPPGAKRIRITKPGYRSEERVVGTDPERPAATLRIALREVGDERPPH